MPNQTIRSKTVNTKNFKNFDLPKKSAQSLFLRHVLIHQEESINKQEKTNR